MFLLQLPFIVESFLSINYLNYFLSISTYHRKYIIMLHLLAKCFIRVIFSMYWLII